MGILESYRETVEGVRDRGVFRAGAISSVTESIIMHEYANMIKFPYDYGEPARDLAFGRFIQLPEIPRVTKEERIEIYEKEKYERDMILNDLKFSTHIMMSKYVESSYSRRFVATNDSCLSFCQVTMSDAYFRWVFVSRSTEVNRMLPADLLTIGTIIEEWTNWFRGYTKYNAERLYDKKVSLVLLMNNPHYYK